VSRSLESNSARRAARWFPLPHLGTLVNDYAIDGPGNVHIQEPIDVRSRQSSYTIVPTDVIPRIAVQSPVKVDPGTSRISFNQLMAGTVARPMLDVGP
jgi:hypothetical protein